MLIGKQKVVSIDYTLTDGQGKVLDTSQGKQPLVYMHGANNIIPGLERELEGKSAGEKVNLTVEAKDAYGERDPRMIQPVPRTAFKGIENIQPGMQFQAQTPNGVARMVTVVSVEEHKVTIDANHPLAGMALTFDVTVVDVREPSEEEKSHGYVHGPDGHPH